MTNQKSETGWLIEAGEHASVWLGIVGARVDWVADSTKAARFANEESAKSLLVMLDMLIPMPKDVRVTEHMWSDMWSDPLSITDSNTAMDRDEAVTCQFHFSRSKSPEIDQVHIYLGSTYVGHVSDAAGTTRGLPDGLKHVAKKMLEQPREEQAPANIGHPVPRRIRVDLYSDAEWAIMQAMAVVESSGADERLTKAVLLLSSAKDMVADYVDQLPYDTMRNVNGVFVQFKSSLSRSELDDYLGNLYKIDHNVSTVVVDTATELHINKGVAAAVAEWKPRVIDGQLSTTGIEVPVVVRKTVHGAYRVSGSIPPHYYIVFEGKGSTKEEAIEDFKNIVKKEFTKDQELFTLVL